MRSNTSKAAALVAGILIALFPLSILRAEVTADPSAAAANRPTVGAAQNGTPLVQITAPTAGGVSRNLYQTYSVDPVGVVLNNSRTITQTQQAGWIEGNPNLCNSGSARIILNEVTSTNRSLLRGYTEVAGQKADVVIANPNGITCNGCGFINTSRGILTTGQPELNAAGQLTAINVNGGDIAIEGLGLNASNIDQVDLLTRSVAINAELWANALNVVTGPNRVDYVTLNTQPLGGTGAAPQFSLDVAALGGMYANRIRLIGTEAGVGVRSAGTLAAQAGDFTLDVQGNIELTGRTSAAGTLSLAAIGLIDNAGAISAGGTIGIAGNGFRNTGSTAAAGNLVVAANAVDSSGTLAAGIDATGNLGASGDLTIQSSGAVTATGQNLAAGRIQMSGASLNLAGSTTTAGDNVALTSAGEIDHRGGTLHANSVDIDAVGTLRNDNGVMAAAQNATVRAGSLTNTAGTVSAEGVLALNLTGSHIHGVTDTLRGGAGIAVTTGGDLAVAAGAALESDGYLHLTTVGNFDNAGTVAAGTGLTATIGGNAVNHGFLSSQNDLTFSAATLDNAGLLAALNDLTATITGRLTNRSGSLIYAGRDQNLYVDALTNEPNAELWAGNNLTIQRDAAGNRATEVINDIGRIEANGGDLTIRAETILNQGTDPEVGRTLFGETLAGHVTTCPGSGSNEYCVLVPAHRVAPVYDAFGNVIGTRDEYWVWDFLQGGAGAGSSIGIFGWQNYGHYATTPPPYYDPADPHYHATRWIARVTTQAELAAFFQRYPGVEALGYHLYWGVPAYATDGDGGRESEERGARLVVNGFEEYLVNGGTPGTPGRMLAGGNITLDGQTITNAAAEIAAANDIALTGGTLINRGRALQRSLTVTRYYERGNGESQDAPQSNTSAEPIGYVPSIISAGGTINGNLSGGVVNDNQASPALSTRTSDGTVQIVSAPSTPAPADAITLPNGSYGYFVLAPPNANYLIETNPRFADRGQFLSSDYMLARLGIDPEESMKRLGDGQYEQRSVQDQILKLTGRRFLDDHTNNEAQYQALLDAGISVAQEFQLQPGMSLSAAQMASLTSDIVWLEERVVKGRKVLVPVVYLTQTHKDDLGRFGALIAANDIQLKTAGDLVNSGTLRAGGYSDIEAKNVLNQGGTLQAGRYSYIAAENDIVNQSGTMTAADLKLKAGRDIRLETETGTHTAGPVTATLAGKDTRVDATGSLRLEAGRDITANAAKVSAGTDLTLNAGRDVNAGTVTQHVRSAVVYSGGNVNSRYERETTTQLASAFAIGGNATVKSGRDTTLTAATVQTGKNLTLEAQGDIHLAAAKDRELFDSEFHYTKRGALGGNRVQDEIRAHEDHETVRGTTINAGGNVTLLAKGDGAELKTAPGIQTHDPVYSGSLTLDATTVTANQGTVTLKGGDIALNAVSEHHESRYEEKHKSRKATSSQKSEQRDFIDQNLSAGSTISAAAVNVESTRDVNVTGSTIIGRDSVTVKAEGDLHVTAAELTQVEDHFYEEKSKGITSTKKGFSVGKSRTTTKENIDILEAGSSLIASTEGAVSVAAGNELHVKGSDIQAGTTLDVAAQNVIVEDATERYERHFSSESKNMSFTTELDSGPFKKEYRPSLKAQARLGYKAPSNERSKEAAEADRENLKKLGEHDDTDQLNRGETGLGFRAAGSTVTQKHEEYELKETARGSNLTATGDIAIVQNNNPSRNTPSPLTAGDAYMDVERYDSRDGGGRAASGTRPRAAPGAAAGGGDGGAASGSLTIKGSTVTSQAGNVTLQSQGALNILAGTESYVFDQHTLSKNQAVANTKTDRQNDAIKETTPALSLISGNNVTVYSGNDLTVQGSALAASEDLYSFASGNTYLLDAKGTREETHTHEKSTTGLFKSSNFGVTLGKKSDKREQEGDSSISYGSTLGTAQGRLDLEAKDLYIKGSDLVGSEGIGIVADNVTIEAALEHDTRKETNSAHQGGITVALTGAVVDLADKAIEAAKRVDSAQDDRLKAVQAYRATRLANEAGKQFNDALKQTNPDGTKANGTGGFDIQITLGGSSSSSEVEQTALTARVATLTSQGDIDIKARGSNNKPSPFTGEGMGGGAAPGATAEGMGGGAISGATAGGGDGGVTSQRQGGDLVLRGATLNAKNINLDANQDILIQSALESSELKAKNKASSGAIGISFGTSGFGIVIGATSAKGKGEGNTETHIESTVNAQDTLTLTSGQDTTIQGAIVEGNTVIANVGRDLTLESQQDIDNYKNKQTTSGGSIMIGVGFSASASYSQSNVKSTYKSVNEQTAINAGEGGFDITVKNHTDLKGAVIASKANEEKNHLSTKTLSYSNIENEAEYSASSYGISLSYSSGGSDGKGLNNSKEAPIGNWSNQGGKGSGITPSVGLPQSGKESSTTYAAISPAQIEIRDEKAQKEKTGQTAEETLAGLSRDPANANNALAKIFDQKKVEETQELTRVLGEEIYQGIGDLAANRYKAAKDEEAKATQRAQNAQLAGDAEAQAAAEAEAKIARDTAERWNDGGAYKIALHALGGAALAKAGNASVTQAVTAATLNEITIPTIAELAKKEKLSESETRLLHQLTSLAVGGAVGGTTGASVALTATQNNYLKHDQIKRLQDELRDCLGAENCEAAVMEKYRILSEANDLAMLDCKTIECVNGHIAEIDNAKDALSDLYRSDSNGKVANRVRLWQSNAQNNISAHAVQHIRIAREEAIYLADWTKKNCQAISQDACARKLAESNEEAGKLAHLIATLAPGIGFADDLKSLLSGTDLRGDEQSRLIALFGVVTAGYGSKIAKIAKLEKIGEGAKDAGKLGDSAGADAKLVDSLGKDAPYDSRTMRSDLEAKHGPDNVTSTTVPPTSMPNVKLAGQEKLISLPDGSTVRIVFDQKGFPIFDDVAKYDTRLPISDFRAVSYQAQMKMATRDLAEKIGQGVVSRSQFTDAQLRAIISGSDKIPGYTWHHHQDSGRMQLVSSSVHEQVRHVGWESMSKGR